MAKVTARTTVRGLDLTKMQDEAQKHFDAVVTGDEKWTITEVDMYARSPSAAEPMTTSWSPSGPRPSPPRPRSSHRFATLAQGARRRQASA